MPTRLANHDVTANQILTLDLSAFRTRACTSPLFPYDELDPAFVTPATAKAKAEEVLQKGWIRDGVALASLAPPIPFDAFNRSFSFHVHAWEPLTFLLPAYGVSAEHSSRCLEVSRLYAFDWMRRYQQDLLGLPLEEGLSVAQADFQTQAWYDMGVGQRIYRLAYLLDLLARDPAIDDGAVDLLFRTLVFHHELLARDSFFVGHTNHGLYQALGQLAAARRFLWVPGFTKYYQLAEMRLAEMLERSFFPSGTHKEHSPGYHYMILASLLGARRSKLLTPELDEKLDRAETQLAWMTCPDGSFVPIGDTDHKATPTRFSGSYRNPQIHYLWSDGAQGTQSATSIHPIADAGYVFVRVLHENDPPSRASYLAQIAGFHSRTHKHADHLSFVWYDWGQEILIDPGRFSYGSPKTLVGSDLHNQGFWYSDPRRIYVEKTRAHNCIEIDGRDYPRKNTKPFGSALLHANERNGVHVTSCAATHFRYVRHWRGLVYRPRHFLIVLDWLHDRTLRSHTYKQWFQLAPQFQAQRVGNEISARSDGMASLRVASLLEGPSASEVVRGQTEPELQGWRSDKPDSLVPTPSFHFAQSQAASGVFATIFVFSDQLAIAGGRTNASATKGRLVWSDDVGSHTINFSRKDDRFDCQYDC